MFLKYMTNIKDNEIILSNKLIPENHIVYKKVLLHIGCWKKELTVKYEDHWQVNVLGLPENLSKDFMLPDSIPYKIRFEDRKIYVGPVIALLFVTNHKTLTPDFLSSYKCYLLNYNDVNGLVFIGSSEGINIENQTMRGFFYQQDSDDPWIEGVFPYPNALYKRTGISEEKYSNLVMHLGDQIFNTYFFNKWELWQCLSPYEGIKAHLPHTEKLTDTDVLLKMVEHYGSVYLKKVSGEKSLGIYKVKKLDTGYEFIDRHRKQYRLANINEVSAFVKEIVRKNGSYIVQQAVKGKRIEDRSFDIRVVLQKDENKEWSCTGMIARFGGTGSIASNIGLSGMAKRGREALEQLFNLTSQEAIMKENDIIRVCSNACEMLNKSIGHYGDLGIDIILDESQKVWILEINKLHYHPYPVYALKDRKMYYDIASTPLKYCSALAGFK